MPAWIVPAVTAAAGLIGQGIAKGKDARQIVQQGKLNEQQIEANTKMLAIQNNAAYEMWEKTGYGGQKEQMMKAGINPALMYGMGGGGGQSMGTQAASVGATKAQGRTGNESEQAVAMGMQLIAQTELLKAQKDNVEADTRNKNASALDQGASAEGKQYDNIIKELLTNRDKDGNLIQDPEHDKNRVLFQHSVQDLEKTIAEKLYRIDENKRQDLMNSASLTKVREEISLMKKQGKTQEEMANNLYKDGVIKDFEIEWAKSGLTRESLTKFIQLLILKAL